MFVMYNTWIVRQTTNMAAVTLYRAREVFTLPTYVLYLTAMPPQ
jgi:hypothetical protein